MKKVINISMVCLMTLSICAVFSCKDKSNDASDDGEISDSYVDLGLPSGTKWKTSNEVNAADAEYDFFTYDEAVSQFGNRLPTKEQWEELKDECQWSSWIGYDYEVTGPNGNSITLPAAGFRLDEGNVLEEGTGGIYWSSMHDGSEAWSLDFRTGKVRIFSIYRSCGLSVRLVQD